MKSLPAMASMLVSPASVMAGSQPDAVAPAVSGPPAMPAGIYTDGRGLGLGIITAN